MKLWQISLLVGLGIAYGLIAPGRLAYAFGHATLYVFLPALLFEAAWNLNHRAAVREWRIVAALAGPGVILTAAIVAGTLSIAHVPLGPALLTGAVLSATDPIAVVAVFRRLSVSKTLATIVECEALFNDAVAVVLYRAVLASLLLGSAGAGTLVRVGLTAAAGAVGGVLLGVTVAFAAARILRNRANAPGQIIATAAGAYAAYFAADYAGLSGIFATIAFGIALRYYERRRIAPNIAADVGRFWDAAALIANALVFFMVGAALQIGRVTHEPTFVAACIAGVVVARVALGTLLPLWRYPRPWANVVRAAGMRGGLSLALALAIPSAIAYRQTIIDAAFATVLATLVLGSAVLVPIAKRGERTAFSPQTPSG